MRYSPNGGTTFGTYYYVLNLQGDVVKLITSGGTVIANYEYNAWGELLSVTNASGTAITSSTHIANLDPLRYRGYYYDTETGFYYLQSRYYDPVTHRFINADSYASTGQGIVGTNMFAYCLNNPVNMTDPSGTSSSSSGDSNGNGIPDYLDNRWFLLTEKYKIQFASANGSLRDVTEEVDSALLNACLTGRSYRTTIENAGFFYESSYLLSAYKQFYNMVNHEAAWDIKRKEQWEATIGTDFPGNGVIVLYRGQAMTPEDIGNYTYGVIGNSFGFSLEVLIMGSQDRGRFSVLRETITQGTTTRILDFIYDESGRPFAMRYSPNGGTTFGIYYYVLNLQGDVVKLITSGGTVIAN